MSVIPPQVPARLRRTFGRFVGPAGAALFSLVLASCAGGGFGGAPDTPAVNPASQPAPVASGPISPASQRNVAEALSGLKLGDETPPISPEDIAVSDDAEILNRNPFSSSAPAARASGWGARADSTRKTQGYKAFEVAVPSENPLMTVAVWISETPPDYPEGKPEQDPEADRKFLYLRLQVFIAVRHVALVEGGGIEVLDSEVIVVEEKRPDPKPQPACGTGEFRDGEGSCAPILGADLLCPSGTMPANGLTTAELNMTLRLAARGGDATRVCEALRRGAEVNDNLDDSEFTPLQEAVSGGHLEAAKVLLANGAEVNKRKDGAGRSPLDLAARDGEAEIAALLRNADGRCFVETGPLCQSVPVATPDPVTVVNTVAATVAAGSCPAGTLPTNGMTQAQLDDGFLGAALENDVEEVCEYLRRGANIEIRTDQVGRPHHNTALVITGRNNYLDLARLLLSNGADVDSTGGIAGGWSALYVAAYEGHADVARVFLDAGANPDVGLEHVPSWTPLHEAAYYNNWRIMKVLLTSGANPNIQTARTGWRGGAPLHYVFVGTRSGSALAVSVLVAGGAKVNLRDSGGNSALDLAARDGEAEIAALLRNADGRCFVETGPLCQSVPVATPDPVTVVNTVAATVAAGSCPAGTLPTNGMTQAQLDDGFLGAALENDVEEVCEYLRRGANIEIRTDQVGRPHHNTALVITGRNNYLDLARLLLSNGADVDSTGGIAGGWSALYVAAYEGHADVARVFLDAGANPDVGLEHVPSWTPLHEAAYYNNWRIMKVLLTSGANPNIQTARTGWRGGAPLHYVFVGTRSGSALAVSVLVAGGAKVNLRDSGGNSALDLAARDGEAEIAALLRNADGRCFVETGPLCQSVPVATPDPVTVVNTVAATVAAGACPAGTLDANGLTQAQLDYEFLGAVLENDLEEVCNYLRRGANIEIRTDQVGRPHHRSEESATALMIAAGRNNYSDLARLLLSNGAWVLLTSIARAASPEEDGRRCILRRMRTMRMWRGCCWTEGRTRTWTWTSIIFRPGRRCTRRRITTIGES